MTATIPKYSSWPSPPVASSRLALEDLKRCVNELDVYDDRIEGAMCRLLVVRACGHIEFSLERGILDSFEGTLQSQVFSYLEAGFFKGRNPRPARIQELLSAFSEPWGLEIKEFFDRDDELLRRELEFLVDRRNKIAHGQSEGIGRRKALDLCEYAFHISDKILEVIQPR